jgi:superoxide dismutase, Cu-Zn family
MNKQVMIVMAVLAGACSQPASQAPSPSPAAPARSLPASGPGATAAATIRDGSGKTIGSATFTDTYAGVLIAGTVADLGLGAHGIHIHEIGKCDGPGFTTAGGHFNPEHRQHGFKNPNGPHLGDLPNIDTPASGPLHFEFLLPGVTLKGSNALLDADGAAIVIHAGRDDFSTDPSGSSGGRIACGVIAAR